mgnify:CR=1 FL=1
MGPRLLYVLGTSFSGSSLLNAILGRHPEVLALNELANLGHEVRDTMARNPRHPLHQPLWQEVRRRYEMNGARFSDIDLSWRFEDAARGAARRDRWRAHNEAVFEALRFATNASLWVDTSKNGRRLQLLLEWSPLEVYALHLVRDGRAVVSSALDRGLGLGRTMLGLHLDWARSASFARSMGPRFMRLRHADLVTQPRESLRALCAWIGLSFDPSMLDLSATGEHPPVIGPKGYWMLRRPLRLEAPRPKTLSAAREARYRLLGGPRRDAALGV